MKFKKIKLLLLLSILFFLLSCDGLLQDEGELIKGNIYNSTDGNCFYAQESLDFYVDGKFIKTLKPAENYSFSLKKGKHLFETILTESQTDTKEPYTLDIESKGWWYSYGCINGTDGNNSGYGHITNPKINIDMVEWFFDNVSSDFFESSGLATMYSAFIFHFSNLNNADPVYEHQFKHIYISHPLLKYQFWDLNLNGPMGQERVDIENGSLLGNLEWLYTTEFSIYGSVMPLGVYSAKIVLMNGAVVKTKFSIVTETLGVNNTPDYIYNSTFSGTVADNYVPGISLAEALTCSKSDDTIKIEFIVSDSRVQTCNLLFYDNSRINIGVTKNSFNEDQLKISSFLNDGAAFYNDGTINNAQVVKNDVQFSSSDRSFQDISFVAILLVSKRETSVDPGISNGYFRSFSPMYPVK